MTPPDASTLFVLLIRVTAILAVAWVIARSRWCGSAAMRHLVWFSAMVASLLVPAIGTWFPPIDLPVPRIDDFSSSAVLSGDAPPSLASAPMNSGSRVASVAAGNPARQTVEPRSSFPNVDWGKVVVAIWLAAGFLRLTWLAVLHSRTRRLTKRAHSLNPRSSLQPLADEIAGTLGVRRPVPVFTTFEVRMPLAWGLFRPVILLPRDALGWSDERLRIVLLHELVHVRRRDYATSLLSELVCIFYWPTPLAWLARRRLRG